MSFLNDVPMATVVTIAAIVGGLIALVTDSIDFEQFLLGIGATTAGAGILGVARNGAGHGVNRRVVTTPPPPGATRVGDTPTQTPTGTRP